MRGKIRQGLIIFILLVGLLLLMSGSALAQSPPSPEVFLLGQAVKTREEGRRIHYLYKEAPVIDLSLPQEDLDYAGLDFKALSQDRQGMRQEVTYFLPLSRFTNEGGAWYYRLDSRALNWEGHSWSFSFRTRLKDGRASAWTEMEGFLDLDREDGRPDLTFDPRPRGRENGVWIFDRPFQITLTVWDDQAAYFDDSFYISRSDNKGVRQALPLKKLDGKVQATFEAGREGSHVLYLFLKDGSGRPIPDPSSGEWPLTIAYRIQSGGSREEVRTETSDRSLPEKEVERVEEEAPSPPEGREKKKKGEDKPQAPEVKASGEATIRIEREQAWEKAENILPLKKDLALDVTSTGPFKANDMGPVVSLNGQALEAEGQVEAVSNNRVRLSFSQAIFKTEGIYRGRLKALQGEGTYNLFSFYLDPKPPQIRPIRGFDRAQYMGDRLALEVEFEDMGGLQEIQRIVDGRTETILLNGERTFTDRFYLKATQRPHRIAYRVRDLAGNITDTRSAAFKPPLAFEEEILVKGGGLPYLFWPLVVATLLLAVVLIVRRLTNLHKFHV